LRTSDSLEANHATYIEDPILNILFGITNSGKFFMNKGRSNLLIKWRMDWNDRIKKSDSSLREPWEQRWLTPEVIILSLDIMLHQVLVANPARGLARNVVIGSEAGASDNNGTSYAPTACLLGYRARDA
jgi:hypothetical protein